MGAALASPTPTPTPTPPSLRRAAPPGAVELVPLGDTVPVPQWEKLPLLLLVGERERVGETVTLGLPLGLPEALGLPDTELQPLPL